MLSCSVSPGGDCIVIHPVIRKLHLKWQKLGKLKKKKGGKIKPGCIKNRYEYQRTVVIALPNKPDAVKCELHRTIHLMSPCVQNCTKDNSDAKSQKQDKDGDRSRTVWILERKRNSQYSCTSWETPRNNENARRYKHRWRRSKNHQEHLLETSSCC